MGLFPVFHYVLTLHLNKNIQPSITKKWVPEDLTITYQIDIDDNKQGESESFFSTVLVDSIENKYARDPGYIYFKTNPRQDFTPLWKELVQTQRAAAGY